MATRIKRAVKTALKGRAKKGMAGPMSVKDKIMMKKYAKKGKK